MKSETSSRQRLADLVRRLAPKKKDGSPNVTALARMLGRSGKLNVGAAQRVLSGDTSVGLDLLDDLADALGERPWVLIRPAAQPVAEAADQMEMQLLSFWRGMTPQRRDDLLLMANRWYSEAHPHDGLANPFQKKAKAR